MKAKIVKVNNIAKKEYFFGIYVNDSLITCFSFDPTASPDSIYNEDTNYKKALETVKRIEAADSLRTEEIIYETN